MNKAELITRMAEVEGTTKKAAGEQLDAVVAVITEVLTKGEEVKIPGFGTFSVSERAARTGRNPQTGAEIQIAASKAPKFKAAKNLKDKINA